MRLTAEEEAMLAGDQGPATRKAMEIVVALANIYEAEELVPVVSAQVAGVSYGNLGDAGLEFLQEWADQGARVKVPTTLNPAGMDLKAWRELGIPEEYAARQSEIIEAYRAMGIAPSCSCTPYLVGNSPGLGQHVAWSESSAVSYANSVLGARTNREGGPSALAAAISGRTANYGLHLDENRRARHLVEVNCPVESVADFGALGYMVGQKVGDAVTYFHLNSPDKPGLEQLKVLGAAMAASGAVALYHVEGATAEARIETMLADDPVTITIERLDEGYEALDGTAQDIDLVWIGCPHASLMEIEEVTALLEGREVLAQLWVTTAREVLNTARASGLVDKIEACGGRVVADACLIGAPIHEMGFGSVATNSGKGAFYLSSHLGVQVRFGSLHRCVEAAVTGKWLP
ncbi:MAG: aconitase X catalytic domain-containing protein [Anaerolineae bacterium]